MDSDITFYSDLSAVIKPSNIFRELVIAAADDINEDDEEILTPARSKLKIPARLEMVLNEFKKSYLPKIFDNSFHSLFNQSDINAATEPHLYSCRKGTFIFQLSAVFSVFIIFRVRPSIGISVEEKDDQTKSALIDKWDVASFITIPGKCAIKFDGEGEIILANITFRKELPPPKPEL